MTVEELKALLDGGRPPLVLDVREPAELAIARFPFEVLNVPMSQLARRLSDLPRGEAIVCACRSGGRSAAVVQFLHKHGFAAAVNLEGGIQAWSRRVDPHVPLY